MPGSSHGRICLDLIMSCHTGRELAEQSCYRTHKECTDPGPTNHADDPIPPDAGRGSHESTMFEVSGMA